MPTDYEAIRRDNEVEYGKGIRRWGPTVLANRYDDRTHFIFEILQNVEDALKKRGEWNGNRSVAFSLSSDGVTISHFGMPFDEADVRGVCGIALSNKEELTNIGRFGVGFKSVYSFTDNPAIHSGDEHFTIEHYVLPRAVQERSLQPEETTIYLPFRNDEPSAKEGVLNGLRRLDLRTLLFLREIEKISWSTDNGPSGTYLRDGPKYIDDNIRKVMLIGQDEEEDDVSEEWIVFSRPVFNDGKSAGHVEIAFKLDASNEDGDSQSVQHEPNSPLVVFFPTILSTNLGFVVQGPYRTTPSRDNVPGDDPWNKYLVEETAALLQDALVGLRELGLLDVTALQCLPIEKSRFPPGIRFASLFLAVRGALMTKPLLPAHGGGYVAGEKAMLARTQALRDLLGPEQLSALFSPGDELVWLSGEITTDRTHNLHKYLTSQLGINEVTPDWLVRRLDTAFLEAQSDEWIERLYRYLNGQRGIFQGHWRLPLPPLVRLEDGSHITFNATESPNAYLPGNVKTGYPTVRRSVCQSDDARNFLEFLGLRVPAAVDDVITNVLPKYCDDQVDVSDCEYRSDIDRILAAFDTDLRAQRNQLLIALQKTKFVAAVDTGSGASCFVRPDEVYLATANLKNLFEGVPSVLMVDDSKYCLRGDHIGKLLQAARIKPYLLPTEVYPSLKDAYKYQLRLATGYGRVTKDLSERDYKILGLTSLLVYLGDMPIDQTAGRAAALWDALCDLHRREGNSVFDGLYQWKWWEDREASFPAHFVKTLRDTAWVPSENGTLQLPSAVVFKETGWEENPFLQEKIGFKPEPPPEVADVLNTLAEETGIDPETLAFIKERGITLAQLEDRFSEPDRAPRDGPVVSTDETPLTTRTTSSPSSTRSPQQASSRGGSVSDGTRTGQARFSSYIAVSPDETDEDSDDTQHQGRMSLEAQAIDHIVLVDPSLHRTPPNNPGFDLIEPGSDGKPIRWVEVKAMSGTFDNGSVTMTRTQFKFAQEHQDAYWLYVVENAGTPAHSRIIRIKDPAGKAQTFTFDHGWAKVAENST